MQLCPIFGCRHNEIDEPMFTQPLMYQAIKRHKNALNVRSWLLCGPITACPGQHQAVWLKQPCTVAGLQWLNYLLYHSLAPHCLAPQVYQGSLLLCSLAGLQRPHHLRAPTLFCHRRCTRTACCGRAASPRSRYAALCCAALRCAAAFEVLCCRAVLDGPLCLVLCSSACDASAGTTHWMPRGNLQSALPSILHSFWQIRSISDKVQKMLHDAFEGAKDYKPKKVLRAWVLQQKKWTTGLVSVS